MRSIWATLFLTLTACATADEAPAADPADTTVESAEPAPDEASHEAGLAPFPYTAAQIRAAHPTGTEVRFALQNSGQPSVEMLMRFDPSNDELTVVTTTVQDERGNPLGVPQSSGSTWEELRRHAAFPAERTVRTRETCTVPAGTYDCWLYTVETAEGSTKRYWFALEKPGPPVRLEEERDGAVSSTMSLLSYDRG